MRDQCAVPDHPLDALTQGGALAVITLVEGSSYRDPGTMMAILPSGQRVGDLTGGCIEADVTLHALAAMKHGDTRVLRYGAGSPFVDLRLPCGGAIEVTILPNPDPAIMARASALRAARLPFSLVFGPDITISDDLRTGWRDDRFATRVLPDLRFAILGDSTEAQVFAATVEGAGYVATRGDRLPDIDAHTAIAMFYHDHDREIPLLLAALQTQAFYIGAQGSRKTAENRATAMRLAGADPASIARIHGPIGLIPQARDARVLAVSVLAEVLDHYLGL